MGTGSHGDTTQSMAYEADERALPRDRGPAGSPGGGGLPAGSVHDPRAGGDGAPLGGGAAPGPGPAVPGGRGENGRLDDDGHESGAVAAQRRGRLPGRARPDEGRGPELL